MASARKLDHDINTLIETLYRLVRSFRVHEGGNEGVKQVCLSDLCTVKKNLKAITDGSELGACRIKKPLESCQRCWWRD